MTDSPPLKVTYAELPDSPIQKVAYEGVFSTGDVMYATPQRKPRRPYKDRKWKRQKTSSGRVSSPIPDNPSPVLEEPWQSSPLEVLDVEDVSADISKRSDELSMLRTPSSDVPSIAVELDNSYTSFVEAVMSDDCSFYQLNQKLFVVNGWNTKKNEASVRPRFYKCTFIIHAYDLVR